MGMTRPSEEQRPSQPHLFSGATGYEAAKGEGARKVGTRGLALGSWAAWAIRTEICAHTEGEARVTLSGWVGRTGQGRDKPRWNPRSGRRFREHRLPSSTSPRTAIRFKGHSFTRPPGPCPCAALPDVIDEHTCPPTGQAPETWEGPGGLHPCCSHPGVPKCLLNCRPRYPNRISSPTGDDMA